MNRHFETIRKQLLEERASIGDAARRTLTENEMTDASELTDEMDQAAAEYDNSMGFRLRDREKYYIKKIDRALKKLDDETYGACEDCGEKISLKRLQARPVTTLCIRCKEEQEVEERSYA